MFKKNGIGASYHTRMLLGKCVNVTLACVILLGMLFPAAGQAHAAEANHAMSQNSDRCEAPNRSGSATIFLPLIGNLFQSVRSSAVSMWGGEIEVEAVENSSLINELNDIEFWQAQFAERSLNYEVGKTYVYLYDYSMEAKNFGRSRVSTETADGQFMRINTYVDMTILSKDSSGAVAAEVSMRDPFICSNSGPEEQAVLEDQAIIDALAAPMRFTQNSNGTISDILVLPSSPTLVKNLQKGIINFLQVTVQPSGNQYVATEQGVQGAYNANYQLEEKTDGLKLTKVIAQNDYSELTSLGDKPESLEMSTTFVALIGNEQNVLTKIELTEENKSADGTKDTATNQDGGMDGLSVWSTTTGAGSMELQEVVDAPQGRSAESLNAIYVVDSFSGDLSELNPTQNGIDLAKVDLDAEFDQFEAAPTDPHNFLRIIELTKAAGSEQVVDKIGSRLAGSTNDQVARVYIDLLGQIGTPKAQDYLNGIFNNAQSRSANIMASTTITNQKQALQNMVILTKPVTQTVSTLRDLSFGQESELSSTAQKALGSTVNEFGDDALEAELLEDLIAELDQAQDVDELIDVLYAIGNLGAEDSLDTLTNYITGTIEINGVVVTDTIDILDINATAYESMVDIPGFEAEDILIDALLDDSLDDWLWDIIVDILLDRDVYEDTALSQEAYDILMEFLDDWYDVTDPGARNPEAIEADLRRNWNWAMGGEKVGVRMPGSLYVATPPESNQYGGGLYLYADQQVNAYVWNPNDNIAVAGASVTSRSFKESQQFRTRVTLGNNLISQEFVHNISCNQDLSIALFEQNFQVFSLSFSLLAATGVPVTLQIEAGGNVKLSLIAGANTCAGNNPSIYGGIEPRAEIVITGRVFLDLLIARAGGELEGVLMSTGIPITATLALTNSNPPIQVCLDVKTVTNPFSATIRLFVDVFDIIKGDYVRKLSLDIYTYTVPITWEYQLWKYCFPEPNGSDRFLDAMNGGVTFFTTVPDASCGNTYSGFWAGRQLLNTHWQPNGAANANASICRGTAFPAGSITYLLRKDVSCPAGSSRLGYIAPSAFSNSSEIYRLHEVGMTMCRVNDESIKIDNDANFYLSHNLVNCRAGDKLAGHIYPDKFSSAPPQLDHFGMTVCERD